MKASIAREGSDEEARDPVSGGQPTRYRPIDLVRVVDKEFSTYFVGRAPCPAGSRVDLSGYAFLGCVRVRTRRLFLFLPPDADTEELKRKARADAAPCLRWVRCEDEVTRVDTGSNLQLRSAITFHRRLGNIAL